VSLSTSEAMYIAMTEVIKEVLWLKGLAKELRVHDHIVIIYCDSSSAIQVSKNQVYHEITKHIDVKLHFVREEIT